MACALPCPHEAVIVKDEEGKEQNVTIRYNGLSVKLPKYDHPLFLVVAKGFGKTPMMLLTSCPINTTIKETIWRIIEIYLTRWKCDESFRYIKQCYNLEDIRVRSYISSSPSLALPQCIWATIYASKFLQRGSTSSRRGFSVFQLSFIMPSPMVFIPFFFPIRPAYMPQQERQKRPNFNEPSASGMNGGGKTGETLVKTVIRGA